MVMALFLGGVIGWRNVFIITGMLGIVMAVVMFFGLKEAPRGQMEPEMEGMEEITTYRFEWRKAVDVVKIRTMWMIFIQGFFGVIPWNVITYWFFVYLERERGYDSDAILITMAPAVIIMAIGYPVGGALGDWLFKKTKRGRIIIATIGVIMGALLLYLTMIVPLGDQYQTQFMIYLCLAAFFMPWPSANVLSTVYDITLPEIRSTANAVESDDRELRCRFCPAHRRDRRGCLFSAIRDHLSLHRGVVIMLHHLLPVDVLHPLRYRQTTQFHGKARQRGKETRLNTAGKLRSFGIATAPPEPWGGIFKKRGSSHVNRDFEIRQPGDFHLWHVHNFLIVFMD